jgi:hypothetical protein
MTNSQLDEKAIFDVARKIESHEVRLHVEMRRFQAEAAALLGVTLPIVEPAPEPAAKVEEAKEQPKSTPAPEAAKEEETSNK